MAVDKAGGAGAAADVRQAAEGLVRRALKGALGTLERGTGYPYASLVTVATEPGGGPILLISRLALHTRNLEADPRASLMIDGTAGDGDPLAGGRVTLVGRCAPTTSATAPRRFLARHPAAEVYAGFADFRFFGFEIERAHFVGGFGRIVDLDRAALVAPEAEAGALTAVEADIVGHMNADHTDALSAIAVAHGAETGDGWRMTGIDPGGFDMLKGAAALRVPFPAPVRTAGDARAALVAATKAARDRRRA
jgi:hypothetical protein